MRGPSNFGNSAVTIPQIYIRIVLVDNKITYCSESQELTDLISVATYAIFKNDDHLVRLTVTPALATTKQLLQYLRNLI